MMVFKSTEQPGVREIFDSERNINLRRTRGVGRGVDRFELDWNGDIIKFDAYGKHGKVVKNIPLSMAWTIYCFQLPDSLKDKRSEAMDLMEEALYAYGYSAKKDWNGQCTVDFAPEIER